jgi:hypothetical protein
MNDKTNRIPPKGHLNRCRYWRDKRILQQLEQEAVEISFAIEDSTGTQKEFFKAALNNMQKTIKAFKFGWQENYNT